MPADLDAGTPAAERFRPANPVVIGLLGGIASGKSAVAQRFAEHGLCAIDADGIGQAVSRDPAVLAEVAAALGPGTVRDGALDRPVLAALVFRDAAARQRLEAILHPRIRAQVLADLAAAKLRGESVLLDVPLLLENGLIEQCDHVVFVRAELTTRLARAAARGWSPEELARREAVQAPLAQKRARARFVVDNDGDLATMRGDVAAVLAALRQPSP